MPGDDPTSNPRIRPSSPPERGATSQPIADPLRDLSRAAAAGDSAAFSELHSRFSGGLKRLFLDRSAGRDDLAEDLAQRTWMLAWKAVQQGRYDPARAALSTFVYAVGHNVWLQHLRQAGRQSPMLMGDPPEPKGSDVPPAPDAQELSAQAELLQSLREALREGSNAGLTNEERAIVRGMAGGESDRDLARRLSLAPSTINTKKRAGIEKIRRFLAAKGHRGDAWEPPESPDNEAERSKADRE